MGKITRFMVFVTALTGITFGGYFLWDQSTRISTAELERIVRRDALTFEAQAIPEEVIDQLAANRVVLVGELHFLREHRQLVAELLRALHARGFRQYLFEWTQAADWLLKDFVNDGGLEPEWTPPHDIGGEALTAIRDFNRLLPKEERIRVHAIDVHLQDYGGTEGWNASLGMFANHFTDPGPITHFLQGDHSNSEQHRNQLDMLQRQLEASKASLVKAWGEVHYSMVVEMVDVEIRAVVVRETFETDYDKAVRLREEAIQWLADRRIAENQGGTLVNFGSTHAQKGNLWGTDKIEWLGNYLTNKSPIAAGSTMVLNVSAAHIAAVPGSGIPDFYLTDSPDNELFRVMSQTWPDRIVFLALDDPHFDNGRVPVNASGEIYVAALQQHFDAFVLLPFAQRDFVGD